ncbi:MAG: hypothetical protein KGL39_29965 [Patescibacteria group bacterium]|nr:hypothetical protein [Patescibacteria group bacterium]
MQPTQGDLFAPPLEEAVEAGREASEEVARGDKHWCHAAEVLILALDPGTCFLAEDIVERLAFVGQHPADGRSMGAVMRSLSRAHLIEKSGRHLPARTSHGSYKPEWRRARP